MGKFIGRIVAVITAPLTLIDRDLGNFVRQIAFTAIGFQLGGPIGASLGSAIASGIAAWGAPKAPPPAAAAQTIKQPISARVRGYGRKRMYGTKVLFETARNGGTVDVYAFHDGEVDGLEQVYLNDDKVTIVGNTVQTLPDKSYQSGHVKAGFTLGPTPNTAFSAVISALPGIWTSNHRGDNVATGYLIKNPENEEHFLDTYPQGDNVELSAVFRLTKCFDPRTGLTVWTENPVLHLLDYLVNVRGIDYATRIVPTLDYWIDAADICDEAIPLKAGGTEPRYRGCVAYEATRQPKEIVASLLECFDGWIAPRGDGAYVIYAGKLYEPTVTLGSDEIIDFNLPYGVASENRVEQLSISYVSALHDYNTVETTPWGPGGIRTDAFSPQVPSHAQARRLAKRAFSRANEFNRGSITTNLGGRIARGQRFINLHIEEGGVVFFSGLVEVVSVKRDFTAGGLAIEWIAVDENIDAWNPETEEGEPAAVGDRVAPLPLDTPVILDAAVIFNAVSEEGVGSRVRITVDTPAPRADYTWFARWKRPTDTAWNEQRYTDVGSGANAVVETGFVPTVPMLDVQVMYRSGTGQSSDWSTTFTVDTSTDAEVPDAAGTPVVLDWRTILRIEVPRIARAAGYRWRVYRSDGTTLVRTINTSGNVMEYTPAQAAADGIGRSYVVTVAGVNSAGEGATGTTGTITNAAPPQVTGLVATGGDYIASLEFDAVTDADLAGYIVFYSLTADFDPLTQGFAETRGIATTQELFTLAAGTYYTRVAAYDGWTYNPSQLNLSDEETFTIAIGTAGGPGGSGDGGGGRDGGGYEVDMPIP